MNDIDMSAIPETANRQTGKKVPTFLTSKFNHEADEKNVHTREAGPMLIYFFTYMNRRIPYDFEL